MFNLFKLLNNYPDNLKRNTILFLILKSLNSVWFVEAVWFFYWSRFANYFQIGIIFSILTIVSLIAEIPTGLFADRYGRKLAINIGLICHIVGSFFIFTAQNWVYLFIGGLIENIGRAFISGALEALIYDDLKSHNQEKDYDQIVSRSIQFSIITFAITVLLGGLLYSVHFRLPNFLMFITFIFASIISLWLIEPMRNFKKLAVKINKQQILIGFSQLLSIRLKPYLMSISIILILFFLYDWGFSKAAMAVNFGFYSPGQGFIYMLMSIINFYLVGSLSKFRAKINDIAGLNRLVVIICIGFILSIFKFGYLGIFILLLIEGASNIAEPWISTIVNKNIDSEFRATTLSTLQFISKTPFLILNIIAGRLLDLGLINYFHLSIGISFLILSQLYYLLNRHKIKSV